MLPSRYCYLPLITTWAHSGKGASHGWTFFTSYNTEEKSTLLEVNASQNDKDFIAAVNWKKAEEYIAQGKFQEVPAQYAHNVYSEKNTYGHLCNERQG